MYSIRDKIRDKVKATRAEKRNEAHNQQRKTLQSVRIPIGPVTISQIEAIAHDVKHKKKDTFSFQLLCNGLSQGEEEIEAFLKVDGALEALIDIWTGIDSEFKYHAGNCLVNLSAGSTESSLLLTKAVSVYMIPYLQSGSVVLQEISALTLGNLACDGNECWDILEKQGLLFSLFQLLKSSEDNIIECACYAISCAARNPAFKPKYLFETEPLMELMDLLKLSFSADIQARCALIFFVISFETESHQFLLENGIIENVVGALRFETIYTEILHHKLVMLLIRILGNFSCVSDDLIHFVAVPDLFHCFFLHLQYNFLVKEALWVLANLAASKRTSNMFYEEKGLISKIVDFADGFGDIATQALLCICHLVSQDPNCVQELINCDILSKLANLLRRPDALQLSLTLLTLISSEINVDMLKSSGCLKHLEDLCNSEDDSFKEVATFLLNKK